jgi:cytoskeleton protein RodZ
VNIGEELRRARENRGISLAEVSGRTKITLKYLNVIERNGFEQLPGGIMTRGFLRAYAREVGLDPEEIVREFLAEHGPPPPVVERGRGAAAERGGGDITAPQLEGLERRRRRDHLFGTVAVVIVGAAVYLLPAHDMSRQKANMSSTAAPPAGDRALEVGTAGDGPPTPGVDTPARPSGVHVEVNPQGPCWVGATADGRPALRRLLKTGERAVVDAQKEAVVRVGDGAACSLSINGSQAAPVGESATPVTLLITAAGLIPVSAQ